MENKTPIEQWIEESRNKSWPKQKGITNTESNKKMGKKVAFTRGCKELLTYLGLSGIDNPREWVEVTKEERVESHVSFWKEKAENNQWRCNQLQSEITKLKSELKQAKADKADAWDEGILDWSNFLDAYASTPLGDKIPDEPTNPYKEETKPDFNQNSMLERFGELEDEFKVE